MAFDDRKRRGPEALLGKRANERVEHLVEEDSPTDHGWLRSPPLELQAHRPPTVWGAAALLVSRETVRRALHRLGFRWRRPRPVPPDKDSEEHIEQKRARLEDVRRMTREEAGSFSRTRPSWRPTPRWALLDAHRQTEASSHPGTNRKVWISGALNFATGRLHWVSGERRNDELFVRLLDKLRRIYRCHKELHLATDNDASHTSKRVKEYVEDSGVASVCIRYLRGRPRATRWSWCGGRCTRR